MRYSMADSFIIFYTGCYGLIQFYSSQRPFQSGQEVLASEGQTKWTRKCDNVSVRVIRYFGESLIADAGIIPQRWNHEIHRN